MKKLLLAFLLLAMLVACQRSVTTEHSVEADKIEFEDQSIEEETTVSPPAQANAPVPPPPPPPPPPPQLEEIFKVVEPPQLNTESYDHISENIFKKVSDEPLSTFSIDVDRASYSLVRRHLKDGRIPPKGAVRIEEMINYFEYGYNQPAQDKPLAVLGTLQYCPWNTGSYLLRVALQGKQLQLEDAPPSNFVFLLDVSGSMRAPNKLPLLKKAFRLMVNNMRDQDRIAIVVYAGSSGLVLPSTPGNEKAKIMAAIDALEAGGSTAGAAGIQLAYEVATENFIEGGNNRVVLATDGDFNVGMSSNAAMVELIEEKRTSGVFLSVLGFGNGNYKDSKMEKLADHGNGNYAYIDNLLEAKKVLVNEFASTLFTIAKDVKLQLEFNPVNVAAYRLIGYENRLLAKEDFNDDQKDAGELGAGHQVTALYELIPTGKEIPFHAGVDDLKYQRTSLKTTATTTDEWLTIKLRYKEPDGTESKLMTKTVSIADNAWEETDMDFQFAIATAAFGQWLRESKYIGDFSNEDIIKLAREAKGWDKNGYRAEFLQLVELAGLYRER
ncbi:MAG: VWA domain-containing protein [Chitinophagales bacterium]|nr:VWA domain-containing protein [Chitinophagales bacterium]